MKGLLLNQYYAVEKTIWYYVPLSLVVTTILLYFDQAMTQRLAAFLPILLLSTAAFEVLKHEAKSGWNKFVLTLPVKRSRVVQSHYLFFLTLTVLGLLIACVALLIAQFGFGQAPSAGYTYSLMNILGITFTMGIVAYPLTYLLGTEKAEFVIMASGGAGIGVFFLSAYLFDLLLMPLYAFQGLNSDLVFSLGFLVVNFILFVGSYIISIQVYKRKEF
ncbi:ABC-2 transporter permease [Alkalihalophilus lindianensis]|uniref:ABC-2 transporter permease n=1 Tax=Alkalihalophilus lindianensis TaxID=1630542 RepID=A0ABU3X4G1_9BACI|nr:ABC-2 transporter permease [Alkalihalophilus lindianensis]MDV2682777.1 ABC-2 transporter permease [Alkalihalophilus lindianensis]